MKGIAVVKGKPWSREDGQGVCPTGEEDGSFQSTVQNAERGDQEAPESWLIFTGFELVS